ncbi:ubiquitin-like protein modifier-activating enzyme atg7-like protein [Dermatophagoides farinae]|uniref:Ubiquitin-like protein modifier-activating enzyme atg7-like protein n=1 Tax=Dermatophagoides farinae TaxID=6954 RepID=A0A9D4P663_DERFA|nr:ubiquitin-like modifier-activating enzyme ATG7 [Dermatophagoides farinae]KAH7644986.1 ubiquitin-like protein modifier-activating enzyme atg7-like protein [Dermatophagoides farinae]
MATNNDLNSSNNNKKSIIEFLPFSTLIDSSFWFEIKRIKLDVLKLSTTPIDICPSFSVHTNIPGIVTLNYEAFESYDKLCTRREHTDLDEDLFYLNGQLIIYNTRDEFETTDKHVLINQQGKLIWDALNDETLCSKVDSSLEYYLARFFMIVYGDFKSYDFNFWNAYPSLSFPPHCFRLNSPNNIKWNHHFSYEQTNRLWQSFKNIPMKQRLFFVILLKPTNNNNNKTNDGHNNAVYFQNYDPEIVLFKNFWSLDFIQNLSNTKQQDVKIIFTFSDYSSYPNYPGWLLRNYLAYIHVRMAQLLKQYRNNKTILWFVQQCLYNTNLLIGSLSISRHYECESTLKPQWFDKISSRSFIHKIAMLPWNYKKISSDQYIQGFIEDVNKFYNSNSSDITDCSNDGINKSYVPNAVGWERNKKLNNRLLPNQVNCGNTLKPEIIATDALYLNLKLMKWRLVQNLELDKIKNTHCLLLGSGTLGCNVARTLVAWGINHITMVDNKNVSFSNPARQSLYTYQDAIGGVQSKAQAAAIALRLINPSIESKGIDLNIKMPGHLFEKSFEEEMNEIENLEKLIDQTDVVFLMTDTRESRWLPTVIATAKHKIIINVALGFDSFLVQRFGLRLRLNNSIDQQSKWLDIYSKQTKVYNQLFPDNNIEQTSSSTLQAPILLGTQLGCYFCNDVFAPSNSTKDRTLDQQCTVTRPGLSMIASGFAVELLMSILQHPAGPLAPSMTRFHEQYNIKKRMSELNDEQLIDMELLDVESLLGIIPHECRGFLSIYEQMTPSTPRLEYCIACSDKIIDKYRMDKRKFLYQAINDSKSLETITGIEIFHNVNDIDVKEFDIDDNSYDEDDNDDGNDKQFVQV